MAPFLVSDAQNNPIVLNVQLFRIITTTCFTLPCRLFYIVAQQVTLLDSGAIASPLIELWVNTVHFLIVSNCPDSPNHLPELAID